MIMLAGSRSKSQSFIVYSVSYFLSLESDGRDINCKPPLKNVNGYTLLMYVICSIEECLVCDY